MTGLDQTILSFVKDFLTAVGYPGLFALMAIEGFGVPIPSELTMPFGGFLASPAGGNKLFLPLVIAVGALGEVAGGVITYRVGRHGGRPALVKYGRFVWISENELDRAEEWFYRYGDWVVFVARLLPAVRSFIALPAGMVRMPFWRFILFSAAGSLVWCAVLAVAGHALGQNWGSVSGGLRRYNVPIVIGTGVVVAFFAYKRFARTKTEDDSDEYEEPVRKIKP